MFMWDVWKFYTVEKNIYFRKYVLIHEHSIYTDIVPFRTMLSHGIETFYRSGTVNSKSFVGKVFLWIKWEFELN